MKTLVVILLFTTILVEIFGGLTTPPCPDGQTLTWCDMDPCEREKVNGCPLHKQATCVSDYCRGCHTTWWLNGKQVYCYAEK